MLPADSAYLTSTSFRADWTDGTSAPGVANYTFEYSTGDNTQTITNINTKSYTLNHLIAGATYSYKVKTLYVDGTESAWSNTQTITLPQDQIVIVGDVNKDGRVTIADVTELINLLLSGENVFPEADVHQDNRLSIADVTALINMLLEGVE